MRRVLLSLTAAAALVSAASLTPLSANAMTAGTASGLRGAANAVDVIDGVRYVCRHRGWSSRRVCWWMPGWRGRHRHR